MIDENLDVAYLRSIAEENGLEGVITFLYEAGEEISGENGEFLVDLAGALERGI